VVKFIGGRTGFRTVRDLALFVIGLVILIYHLLTVDPEKYNVTVFLLACGLMGAPYVIGKDEGGKK